MAESLSPPQQLARLFGGRREVLVQTGQDTDGKEYITAERINPTKIVIRKYQRHPVVDIICTASRSIEPSDFYFSSVDTTLKESGL